MEFLLIQRALLTAAVLSALAGFAHADQMPISSGVIAIATEPVSIKTVSMEGKIIGRTGGVGQPIYLNDEIKTGPQAKLQILLKDQTVFNIGPNSALKIDKFVFDPARPQLSVNIERGAFKFVSGKISNGNPEAMKVKLPNATIAVRGTGVAGEVAPDGAATVVVLHGTVDVSSTASGSTSESNSTATLSKSGWGVQVSSSGSVSAPSQLPADIVKGILQKVGNIGNAAPVVAANINAAPATNLTTVGDANALAATVMNTSTSNLIADAVLRTAMPVSASNSSTLASGVTPTLLKPQQDPNAGTAASIAATAANGTYAGSIEYIKSLGVTVDPSADINYVVASLTPAQQQVIYDAKTDQYLLQVYPDDVSANHFTPAYASSQQSSNLLASLNASPVATPYTVSGFNTSNFGGTTPTASYQFSFQNIPLGCLIGTTCGTPLSSYVTNGVSGNINSHTVVLNFAAASIYNAYDISYSNFGLGNRTMSGNYSGAFSSSFANLAQSGNGTSLVLPTDPSQTDLQMLASFGEKTGGGVTGVFSTALNTRIGTSATASLQATYSGDGVETACVDSSCDVDAYLSTNNPLMDFSSVNATNQLLNLHLANINPAAFALTQLQDGSLTNLGGVTFNFNPISPTDIGTAIRLTCMTGGNSCGAGAFGSIRGNMTLDYTNKNLQYMFGVAYSNFGLGSGTQAPGGTQFLVSSGGGISFSALTTAPGSNGKAIVLPVSSPPGDPTTLKMLSSFSFSNNQHLASVSAALSKPAGSKTITLIGGVSGVVGQ